MIGEQRVRIGASDIMVNRLGMGGGTLTNNAGEGGVRSLLQCCWEAGLRYFDTAPLYGSGESESRFGVFLREMPRDAFTISTKVGRLANAGGQRVFDFTAGGVRSTLDASLKRIGLDRLDMVCVHDIDRLMHDDFDRQMRLVVDEALPVLQQYRKSGIISAVGISTRQSDVAIAIAERAPIDFIMMAGSYTLLCHEPLEALFPFCRTRQISVFIASPFNSGILATGSLESPFDYAPAAPEIRAKVTRMNAICARHAVPIAAAALQFPLYHSAVASIVTGQGNENEIRANLAALDLIIPADFWAEMKAEGVIPADAPTRYP